MATHQVQLRTKEREYFEGPVAEWKFRGWTTVEMRLTTSLRYEGRNWAIGREGLTIGSEISQAIALLLLAGEQHREH
jgi:hypothetical protein